MNREDAAREIDNTACCFSDKRFRDSMHMAAAALRGPQPDPITGLVPCGCGGKVGIDHWREDSGKTEGEWNVICERCRLMFVDNFATEQEARDAWNLAMGWRKQNDKR